MPLSRSPMAILFLALTVPCLLLRGSLAQDCGVAANGALCSGDNCCSEYGFCGIGDAWCGQGCQSGPCYSSTPSPPSDGGDSCGAGVGGVVSESQFNSIFPNRMTFYSYSAFIAAASSFEEFGTDGDCPTRTREIAAFFAHISHETSGLTKINEDNMDSYCDTRNYPCVAGKRYYGRGPLQLSWNYNYAQCGDAINVDLLNDPDLVATDSTISFKAAIWFWQTAQAPKPSCHAVITGSWTPSSSDAAAGRQPGFGMTINIINGGLECGSPAPQAQSRIDLYNSICNTFGVSTGDNLSCSGMTPYPT